MPSIAEAHFPAGCMMRFMAWLGWLAARLASVAWQASTHHTLAHPPWSPGCTMLVSVSSAATLTPSRRLIGLPSARPVGWLVRGREPWCWRQSVLIRPTWNQAHTFSRRHRAPPSTHCLLCQAAGCLLAIAQWPVASLNPSLFSLSCYSVSSNCFIPAVSCQIIPFEYFTGHCFLLRRRVACSCRAAPTPPPPKVLRPLPPTSSLSLDHSPRQVARGPLPHDKATQRPHELDDTIHDRHAPARAPKLSLPLPLSW